jgi:dihydrofolate reductase
MGKIVNSTFVSIDGVINHMDAWHFDYLGDEQAQITLEQIEASDAMLMGRHTYEVYASAWPDREGAYPARINSIRKYVASTSLDRPAWNNTTVIKGDLVAQVGELK